MATSWDPVLAKRHGNKLKADPVAAEAAETEAQIRKRVGKEEQERAAGVTAACDLAGHPERAAAFIAANKSVSEVLAALTRPRG